MTCASDRIYLQVEEAEVSWCVDKIHDSDVEYIRADLVRKIRDDYEGDFGIDVPGVLEDFAVLLGEGGEQASASPDQRCGQTEPAAPDPLAMLDEMVQHGCCPALVNDDFGNWAVLFDGMQPCVAAPGQDGWDSTFLSSKDQKWFTSPCEAIDHAYKEWKK